MKLNKKLVMGASTLVLGATLLGGTLAWLTSEQTVLNKFSTKSWDLDVEVEEDFDEDGAKNLLPGAVIKKEGFVKNSKELPVLVRVHIEEVWGERRNDKLLNNGVVVDEKLTEVAKKFNVAMIDTAHAPETVVGDDYFSENWELIGDYYYYKHVLKPEEQTDLVISDVTINPELTSPKISYNGEIYDVSNKYFDINLTAQAVQIENNAYLSAWEIKDEHKSEVDNLVQTALDNYQLSNSEE